jgi:predicted RNA-binding Zn-ribbon protein involved in translation (DUF1610 family)
MSPDLPVGSGGWAEREGEEGVSLLPGADAQDAAPSEADVARADQAEVEAEAALDDFERSAAAGLAELLDEDLLEIEHHDAPSELEPSGAMAPRAASAAMAITPADDAVAAGAAPDGPEVEVECPGCGLIVVGSDPRASAEWFCPRCDYPLFFVAKAPPPELDGARRGARQRLPGVNGRASSTAGPCWNCGEHNEAASGACFRCAATLPKPLPPQLGPFDVVVEPELVEVEVLYWPPIVGSVIGGFLAGMGFLAGVLMLLDRW